MTDFLLGVGQTAMGANNWLNLFANVLQIAVLDDTTIVEGRSLEQFRLMSSGEGRPIPRIFGRARVGGHIIFADTPKEHILEEERGGKNSGPQSIYRQYHYTMSFAIGLCAGPIGQVGRIWADGQLFDGANAHMRVHLGTEDQEPDPLMQEVLGRLDVPAFRGTAYLVFTDFNISEFGNRIPQFNFEIFARPHDGLATHVSAVNIIPASTEFGYDPIPHIRLTARGHSANENTHVSANQADWSVSMDQLGQSCPSAKWVSLVVSWFGTDLRLGHCQIEPRHEGFDRRTQPSAWQVAGQSRNQASAVSQKEGRPIFGGTPSDQSVMRAIQDLQSRGYKILFYPFVMMDVARGLPDPWGRSEQPEHPWRGEITLNEGLATGVNDTALRSQMDEFVNGQNGLSRMIDHYAQLCASVGGVDAFLVGSEFKHISMLQTSTGEFPFARHLIDLATRVRSRMPDCAISYAADWSEYGARYFNTGAIEFPLDSFWSSTACDFIGIDAYFPLSDWRDDLDHRDRRQGIASIYDSDYLRGQVRGGEYFDYFYRTQADRDQQIRTPFDPTDPLSRQLRAKDILGFWSQPHYRRDPFKKVTQTSWQPQSKPIWFTEIGCPAVDKGSNQPNRFPSWQHDDPGLPYYSTGARDDRIQRLYLLHMMNFYRQRTHNPLSPYTGQPMVPDHAFFVWAWDARPFPAFPMASQIWLDTVNWSTGHWINARLSSLSLPDMASELLGYSIVNDPSDNQVEGYIIDRIQSRRSAMEPILVALGLEAVWGEEGLVLMTSEQKPVRTLSADDLISGEDRVTFSQIDRSRLPRILCLSYFSAERDYEVAVFVARYPDGDRPAHRISLPMVLTEQAAEVIAYRLLQSQWVKSQTASFRVSYAHADLEPGDLISYDAMILRIVSVQFSAFIEIQAVRWFDDGSARSSSITSVEQSNDERPAALYRPPLVFYPDIAVIDLPAGWPARPHNMPWPKTAPVLAATGNPFPNDLRVEDPSGAWSLTVDRAACWGESVTELVARPPSQWTTSRSPLTPAPGGVLWRVKLLSGVMSSRTHAEILNGANVLAVQTQKGWEILQYQSAELVDENEYELDGLLRGQSGSEGMIDPILAPGARVIGIDGRLRALTTEQIGARVIFGPDHMDRQSYAWRDALLSTYRAGETCRAPAHLAVHFTTEGALQISWVRRAPVGGDDLAALDIPIDPDVIGYRIDVFAGDEMMRRQTVENADWSYSIADLRDDYRGREAARWRVWVSQMHRSAGAGYPSILDLTAYLVRHQARFTGAVS